MIILFIKSGLVCFSEEFFIINVVPLHKQLSLLKRTLYRNQAKKKIKLHIEMIGNENHLFTIFFLFRKKNKV